MSTEPTKETSYTLGSEDVDGRPLGKQGHKCCGGCCDVRRAVIVVNIINACLIVLGLMSVLAAKNLAQSATYSDDEYATALDQAKAIPLGWAIPIAVVRLIMAICGIIGAKNYNWYLVAVAALSYVAECIAALVSLAAAGLIAPALFLYPHVFLVKEMRDGIMTPENYPREKFSCCCV